MFIPLLGLELQAQQSQPQDASCLPALKVSDIEPRIPFTEVEVALAGQWGVLVPRLGFRLRLSVHRGRVTSGCLHRTFKPRS